MEISSVKQRLRSQERGLAVDFPCVSYIFHNDLPIFKYYVLETLVISYWSPQIFHHRSVTSLGLEMSLSEIAVNTQKCNGLLIIVHLQKAFFWSLLVKTFNISRENTASMGQKMSPRMVDFHPFHTFQFYFVLKVGLRRKTDFQCVEGFTLETCLQSSSSG